MEPPHVKEIQQDLAAHRRRFAVGVFVGALVVLLGIAVKTAAGAPL